MRSIAEIDRDFAGMYENCERKTHGCKYPRCDCSRKGAVPAPKQTALTFNTNTLRPEDFIVINECTGDRWRGTKDGAFARVAVQFIVAQAGDERMRHDYPILQQFHTKHALGALSAPSCLCCGHQTGPDRPIAVRHMELPAIVICAECKNAADHARKRVQPASEEQPNSQIQHLAPPLAGRTDGSEGRWIPVSERLPAPGKPVLAFFKNSRGLGRTVRAHHSPLHTVDASAWDEGEPDETETGTYEPEGWWEDPVIGERLEFISPVGDGDVTHWMPLPPAPSACTAPAKDAECATGCVRAPDGGHDAVQ